MTTHKKHKPHVFLDGDAITAIQSRLARGETVASIAKSYNVAHSSVAQFDPSNKNYREDLVRIRKNTTLMYVKNGSTLNKPKTFIKTNAVVAVESDNMSKVSPDAKKYIDACCVVFDKSRRQIVDEMVKACKTIGAGVVHEG